MNSVHESPNGKVVWVVLFAQEPCAWRVSWPVKYVLCLGFRFSYDKYLRSGFGFYPSLCSFQPSCYEYCQDSYHTTHCYQFWDVHFSPPIATISALTSV